MNRPADPAAIELIKRFEGCKLIAYLDKNDGWTVGWGYKGPGVGWGTRWTQEHADAMLQGMADGAAATVDKFVKVPLSTNQRAALTSFVYNVGEIEFAGRLDPYKPPSTLLRLLNEGLYTKVPFQLIRWIHDDGQVIEGLRNRRNAEIDLWGKPNV